MKAWINDSGIIRSERRPDGFDEAPSGACFQEDFKFCRKIDGVWAFDAAAAASAKHGAAVISRLKANETLIESRAEQLISAGVEYKTKKFKCTLNSFLYSEAFVARDIGHDRWNTLDNAESVSLNPAELKELHELIFSRLKEIQALKHAALVRATAETALPDYLIRVYDDF